MKLPIVSGQEMIKLLVKQGFSSDRIRGDHCSLHKKTNTKTLIVVVPLHKEIKIGTLLNILRQAEMKRDELIKLLSKK